MRTREQEEEKTTSVFSFLFPFQGKNIPLIIKVI